MIDALGTIYPVTLNGRQETWQAAYRRVLAVSISAYEQKHGGKPTHIKLPSCVDPSRLGLNGLQIEGKVGRGSLILLGVEEAKGTGEAEELEEGEFVCQQCGTRWLIAAAWCAECGYDGREKT